jgi:hypothetical protein
MAEELNLSQGLYKMGVPVSRNDIREGFNLSTPNESERMLTSMVQFENNGEGKGGDDGH